MAIQCCHHCELREVGCHSTCKTYNDQKKIHDEQREQRRKEVQAEMALTYSRMRVLKSMSGAKRSKIRHGW